MILASRFRHVSSKRRRCSALGTRPRLRNGGRLSKPQASSPNRTAHGMWLLLRRFDFTLPTIDVLPHDQDCDDREVEQIESDAGCKGWRVIAKVIVQRAGEPATGRHAGAAE